MNISKELNAAEAENANLKKALGVEEPAEHDKQKPQNG
jgi:hypothetical protein